MQQQNKKQLLVFAHQGLVYLVPHSIIEKAEYYDILYDSFKCTDEQLAECQAFMDDVKKKYKPIAIGYLLTGDLG